MVLSDAKAGADEWKCEAPRQLAAIPSPADFPVPCAVAVAISPSLVVRDCLLTWRINLGHTILVVVFILVQLTFKNEVLQLCRLVVHDASVAVLETQLAALLVFVVNVGVRDEHAGYGKKVATSSNRRVEARSTRVYDTVRGWWICMNVIDGAGGGTGPKEIREDGLVVHELALCDHNCFVVAGLGEVRSSAVGPVCRRVIRMVVPSYSTTGRVAWFEPRRRSLYPAELHAHRERKSEPASPPTCAVAPTRNSSTRRIRHPRPHRTAGRSMRRVLPRARVALR